MLLGHHVLLSYPAEFSCLKLTYNYTSVFKSIVEIKTNQMKASKGYLFRACYCKGVSHHYLHLAKTHRQAEEWKSFIAGKKGKASGMP